MNISIDGSHIHLYLQCLLSSYLQIRNAPDDYSNKSDKDNNNENKMKITAGCERSTDGLEGPSWKLILPFVCIQYLRGPHYLFQFSKNNALHSHATGDAKSQNKSVFEFPIIVQQFYVFRYQEHVLGRK